MRLLATGSQWSASLAVTLHCPLADESGVNVIGLVLFDQDATARDLFQVRVLPAKRSCRVLTLRLCATIAVLR